MVVWQWEESLSVGVKEIDRQHKKLIKMLNDLYKAAESGDDRKVIEDIIKRMSDYTVYHFSKEEKYFDKFDYIYAKQHQEQHQGFVEKVLDFQQEFESGEAELSREVLSFLIDWVFEHIAQSDHQYVDCFQKNGLK